MRDQPARMTTYVIDPQHSVTTFAVKHMQVSTVRGRFLDLQGRLHIDELSPADSWVQVTINAASVDTGVKDRDDHLRSSDFLDVMLHPQIRFQSTKVQQIDATQLKIYGELSLHGVNRPIVLDAVLEGRMVDPNGIERLGFSAETSINRRDFGINWNGWIERLFVADDVKITIDIEAKKEG